MEKIDPDLVENNLIFPDEATLSRAKDFMGLDQKTEQGYQKQFASVVGG
jgi:spermidine/putrescine transport system substrate-binding protein